MSAIQILGKFVHDTAAVPSPIVHEAQRSVLNFVASALAVARDADLIKALHVLQSEATAPQAVVIGQRSRLPVEAAAFINAMAGNWLDFDDTHLNTVIHPTAPVLPVAMALGEHERLSGAEVLLAFVLGAEVECRIGNAVSPAHYARGWHITTTCGVFGAAAAAAKLMRLDAVRTGHALGIAASLSAGVVENLSTGAKNVSMGNCARNGITAARFAAAGYEAAPLAIEGRLGWGKAGGVEPDLDVLFEGLGQNFEFAKNTYKPYPCGIVMHSIIDACFEISQGAGLTADEIEQVKVFGDALLLARGDRLVEDDRDARVSVHHAATAPFLFGAAGLEEFLPPAVFDPDAIAFRQRVSALLDATLPPGAARVQVLTRNGDQHEATVIDAVGSVTRPLSDEALEGKLQALARLGGSGCEAAAIADAVWRMDRAASLDELCTAIAAS